MYKHHEESIRNAVGYFRNESDVEVLLLGGSIAHGFAEPTSDIDTMIIVSDQVYQERLRQSRLHFFSEELCTYADGYVEGKYLAESYLQQVAEKGSEPARFAFQGAEVLLTRGADFSERLQQITRYPVDGKSDRTRCFYAQFEAWNWYANEALRL